MVDFRISMHMMIMLDMNWAGTRSVMYKDMVWEPFTDNGLKLY